VSTRCQHKFGSGFLKIVNAASPNPSLEYHKTIPRAGPICVTDLAIKCPNFVEVHAKVKEPLKKLSMVEVTTLWHSVHMPDERPFALRQIDQARGDLYAIADDLEFIKSQLARLPTRGELARTGLLVMLTTAALILIGMEALFR
jgi:hypothetical protein